MTRSSEPIGITCRRAKRERQNPTTRKQQADRKNGSASEASMTRGGHTGACPRKDIKRVACIHAFCEYRPLATLVEPRGLEPLTPCMQGRCATNCATAPLRSYWSTLWVAVSQSVFSCVLAWCCLYHHAVAIATVMRMVRFIGVPFALCGWCVGLTGIEPVTSSLSAKRSNRLSYRPFCSWLRRITLQDVWLVG